MHLVSIDALSSNKSASKLPVSCKKKGRWRLQKVLQFLLFLLFKMLQQEMEKIWKEKFQSCSRYIWGSYKI